MKSTVYAHLENDYRFYRLPLFRATAVKYGWNNPIGEDSGREKKNIIHSINPKLRNLLEDGEYIPSLGQLNLMAHYMNELNKAFAYVSASPLSSTWYWSSTESSQAVAWYVVFSSGLTGTGNKHIGDMVRAVIDF